MCSGCTLTSWLWYVRSELGQRRGYTLYLLWLYSLWLHLLWIYSLQLYSPRLYSLRLYSPRLYSQRLYYSLCLYSLWLDYARWLYRLPAMRIEPGTCPACKVKGGDIGDDGTGRRPQPPAAHRGLGG